MCCMSRSVSIMTIIPIALLLTLSFFVLLSIRKAETKGLRVFGYVVTGILWVSVLAISLGVVYKIAKDGYQGKCMMHKKMIMRQVFAPAAKVNAAPAVQETQNKGNCGNKGIVSKAN